MDNEAHLGGEQVRGARLLDLGDGVHAFALDTVPLDAVSPDTGTLEGGIELVAWSSADGAADVFTAVEHERVVDLASDWLQAHARRVTTTVDGCATIERSLGIKADMAVLGDIVRSGSVVAEGSIDPQLDAARGGPSFARLPP